MSSPDSVGGGVVADFFPVTADEHQSNSLNSGNFFYISGAPGCRPPFMDTHANSGALGRSAYAFKERNNINSLQKQNLPKVWGDHGPPGPPGYATDSMSCEGVSRLL